MGYNTTPEYETAQSRISTLLNQIGDQVHAIATSPEGATDVDSVIAEQDKSFFIFKQNELISAYHDREVHDERDTYIANLEEQLAKATRQEEYYRNSLYKELNNNRHLKSALKSLTTILNED